MTTNTTRQGTDPLDPAALFGPHLGPLLAAGHRLEYAPDPARDGFLFAGLYDPDGRLVECGLGVTAAAALAHLQQRLADRAEPEPCLTASPDDPDRVCALPAVHVRYGSAHEDGRGRLWRGGERRPAGMPRVRVILPAPGPRPPGGDPRRLRRR
jgi:hypothetical protein